MQLFVARQTDMITEYDLPGTSSLSLIEQPEIFSNEQQWCICTLNTHTELCTKFSRTGQKVLYCWFLVGNLNVSRLISVVAYM